MQVYSGESNNDLLGDKNDVMRDHLMKNNIDGFIQALMQTDGINDKNFMWHFLQREITTQGNYLNIDGQCLSVKEFQR